MKKNEKKTWCALFTCMVVRAIHMELVESLTTKSFIHSLRRFAARRGKPEFILSDNGRNFVLAQKVLDPSFQKNLLKSTEYNDFLKKSGIRFITERAPWKGGFYERMIRLVKNHLMRCLNKSKPKVTKIHTLLLEIEFIINCRPLTFVSDSIDNPTPIRSIDFLSPNINTNLLCPLSFTNHAVPLGSRKDDINLMWKDSLN